MRKILSILFFCFTLFIPYTASAILTMELTRGVASAIPIAVVPFANSAGLPQNVSTIVGDDLRNSGRFKVYPAGSLSQFPTQAGAVAADYFRRIGTDNVVVGNITPLSDGRYQVTFALVDIFRDKGESNTSLTRTYTVSANELRAVSHHISDLIYQQITGVRGVFSTRIAYVVIQRAPSAPTRYMLEISDQDGYNPRSILNSSEPIMSPAWSPNGKQIAYVSFERQRASIYIHDVATGSRHLLSEFPGINGAPAWSPDGKKLALVLSKSGAPNIYVMDIASRSLKQITNDFYINTEPAWSPDARSLLFTSTRSGGPQIYQIDLTTQAISRMTYDGNYNARASYTNDGKHIAMIHKVAGIYNIALLDLDTGTMREISTSKADSASPSIAPNDSMVLFDTLSGGRNVLSMVSSDASVRVLLPARRGDAQDPAWSPFL